MGKKKYLKARAVRNGKISWIWFQTITEREKKKSIRLGGQNESKAKESLMTLQGTS